MTPLRILVKIGGSTLGDADTTTADLVWLQSQGHQVAVVHGGGKHITQWLERLHVPTTFLDGLRVTGPDAIDAVVGVLAGVVNTQIVAAIHAAGGRALGLSGADGGMLRARIKNPALGLVGEIVRVDAAPVHAALAHGYIPVIAPIGLLDAGDPDSPTLRNNVPDKEGPPRATLLNINADTAAAAIGAALGADQFVFLTDVPGVKGADGSVIDRLTPTHALELIASGVIAGGMIPKVEAALRALEGVSASLIVDGRRSHALRDSVAGYISGTRID